MRTGIWGTRLLTGLLATVSLMGCGGSGGADGNNDQGIVFRAVGFVRGPESIDIEQIRCTEPTTQNAINDASFTINLGRERFYPDRNNPFGNPCGGYIALENELSQQAINVQFIEVGYDIPGAGIPIEAGGPITSGFRINSALSQDESGSGQPNLVYVQLVGQMISEETMTFLEQNQNNLPSTPYAMTATFRAVGQSDSGTRYTSNSISYQFTITR